EHRILRDAFRMQLPVDPLLQADFAYLPGVARMRAEGQTIQRVFDPEIGRHGPRELSPRIRFLLLSVGGDTAEARQSRDAGQCGKCSAAHLLPSGNTNSDFCYWLRRNR